MYAVEYGDKVGCFLIYISEEDIFTGLAFLCIPFPLEVLYLSKEDVVQHIKNGGLNLVETLPLPVYEVCRANFQWCKRKGMLSASYKPNN